MKLKEKMYDVITQFACEHYGEKPDDASYNLELLSNVIVEEFEKSLSAKNKARAGMRVRCISMNDRTCEGYKVKPLTITPGTLGTVTRIDDIGQIHVNWDNGSSLALSPKFDEYEFIDESLQSGFSIKRNVFGESIDIELTENELTEAFRFKERYYQIEDIKEKLRDMIEAEDDLYISECENGIPDAPQNASSFSKALRILYSRPETLVDDLQYNDSYWESFWFSYTFAIEKAAKMMAKEIK